MLADTNYIGLSIKKLREDNNLTQKELADKLAISFQAVSKWEKGECYPDLSQIVAISELFNYSLDKLLVERKKTELKKQHEIFESIQTDFVAISIIDFKLSGDTIITINIKNLSDSNIRISPKAFLLMGEGNEMIKPSQSPIIKYNYNTDDDELTGTKYKHEIPDFIPPQKTAKIVLYFEQSYDFRFVDFYPNIFEDLTNIFFRIPRIFFEGIEKPNVSSFHDSEDLSNAINFYLGKKQYNNILDLVVFRSINIENFSGMDDRYLQRKLLNVEVSYGEHDEVIRKLFKENYVQIEERCKLNAVSYNQFIIHKHTFMDDEIIQFVSKMWLRYKSMLLEWSIPYLNDAWLSEMKIEVVKFDSILFFQLYHSKCKAKSLEAVIWEKSNLLSLEQLVQFIKAANETLSKDLIEKLLLSKSIVSIESLRLVKPYLKPETFDSLRSEVIKLIV